MTIFYPARRAPSREEFTRNRAAFHNGLCLDTLTTDGTRRHKNMHISKSLRKEIRVQNLNAYLFSQRFFNQMVLPNFMHYRI